MAMSNMDDDNFLFTTSQLSVKVKTYKLLAYLN